MLDPFSIRSRTILSPSWLILKLNKFSFTAILIM